MYLASNLWPIYDWHLAKSIVKAALDPDRSGCGNMSMVISGTDWLEVPIPYMFGLLFRPKFQGISPENMAKNMVLTYLHLLDPEDLPLNMSSSDGNVQSDLFFYRNVKQATVGWPYYTHTHQKVACLAFGWFGCLQPLNHLYLSWKIVALWMDDSRAVSWNIPFR